jgi:peptidase E
MTTYILHGGKMNIESDSNEIFLKQFTELIQKKTVKILLCYWAREKNRWFKSFEIDKATILKHSSKKAQINIVETVESLAIQLNEADVLFFSGGEEDFLRPYISQLGFLKTALKDKVYIGSSMGSFLASTNYVLSLHGQKEDTVYGGLGLVPYNILCHWNIENNKDKKITMLKEKDPQTPILLIKEQRFEKIIV